MGNLRVFDLLLSYRPRAYKKKCLHTCSNNNNNTATYVRKYLIRRTACRYPRNMCGGQRRHPRLVASKRNRLCRICVWPGGGTADCWPYANGACSVTGPCEMQIILVRSPRHGGRTTRFFTVRISLRFFSFTALGSGSGKIVFSFNILFRRRCRACVRPCPPSFKHVNGKFPLREGHVPFFFIFIETGTYPVYAAVAVVKVTTDHIRYTRLRRFRTPPCYPPPLLPCLRTATDVENGRGKDPKTRRWKFCVDTVQPNKRTSLLPLFKPKPCYAIKS